MKIIQRPLLYAGVFLVGTLVSSCGGNNTENMDKNSDSTVTATDTNKPASPEPSKKLFIDDGGSGGISVVFVHSFGGSTVHWTAQLAHLRTGRRAIALDLRGHGQSARPADSNYSIAALASDIETVVDSLHLQKFVLVGHSMGGAASIEYAGRHPDRLAGLVLEGTPGKVPGAQSKQVMASLQSDQYDTVMKKYMAGLLTHAKPSTDSLEKAGMHKLSKPVILQIIQATFDFDPVEPLKKYTGPTLIVSTPAEDQPGSLQKLFPRIPYRQITGTSHWAHVDKPDAFNKLLDEFLQK